MAEVEEKTAENEAEALERLLGEESQKEEQAVQEEAGQKSRKKTLFIAVGAGVLVVLIGIAVFMILGGEEEEATPSLEELAKPVEKPEDKKKTAEIAADVPNFYALEPFFLPLTDKKQESSQFVHVRINLQMSNQKLNEELDSVLPLVRQNIYEILARKRPRDFNNPKKPIKERLKSEIVASTNTLLVTGSGKIDDVFFAEFIVR